MELASKIRVARAAAFATVCVLLTQAGHDIAADRSVPWVGLVAGLLVVFAAALAGGGREWSRSTITGGLLLGELGLHTLFTMTSAAVATHVASSAVRLAASPMPDMVGMGPGTASAGMHAEHTHAMAMHASMVLTHLVAAVISGWWLRYGEAAAWRVTRRATACAARVLRAAWPDLVGLGVPSARIRPAWVSAPSTATQPSTAQLVRCAPRRGPPLAA